jgi:hypothetical protein
MQDRYEDQPAYVQQYMAIHLAVHENNKDELLALGNFMMDESNRELDEDIPLSDQVVPTAFPVYMLSWVLGRATIYNSIPGGYERMPLDPLWIETIDLALLTTHPKWYLPDFVEAQCAELLQYGELQRVPDDELSDAIIRHAALIDVVLKNVFAGEEFEFDPRDEEQLYWEQLHLYMHGALKDMFDMWDETQHTDGDASFDFEAMWGLPNL